MTVILHREVWESRNKLLLCSLSVVKGRTGHMEGYQHRPGHILAQIHTVHQCLCMPFVVLELMSLGVIQSFQPVPNQ